MKQVALMFTLFGGLWLASNASAAVSSDIRVTYDSEGPTKDYFGISVGNADFDQAGDSSVSLDIFAGVKPWEGVGFEVGYINFGEANSGVSKLEVTGFRAGVVGNRRIRTELNLVGKVGLTFWDADLNFSGFSDSDSGMDIYYGFGVERSLGGRSIIRFSADFYTVDYSNGDVIFDEDITVLSVGFKQEF